MMFVLLELVTCQRRCVGAVPNRRSYELAVSLQQSCSSCAAALLLPDCLEEKLQQNYPFNNIFRNQSYTSTQLVTEDIS